MGYKYDYFPQEMIDLQIEIIKHHPDIQKRLDNQRQKDTEILLAEIASHLNIILDGDYLIPDLCKMLLTQLQKRRAGNIIIIPASH
jgi:hypothetical protein